MTDSLRRTGRSQRAIISAVTSALLGNNVMHVSATGHMRGRALAYAREIIETAPGETGAIAVRTEGTTDLVFTTADNFHHGRLRCVDMRDMRVKGPQHGVVVVDDHAVAEQREAEKLRLERVAAEQQIILLMKKHGLRSVMRVGGKTKVSIREFAGNLRHIDQPE